jgi:lipopolysaccharide export system permease protein
MRILDRYIAGRLVKGYGTVMLFLLSMFSFLALIQELDQVGKGSYRVVDALQYIAFTIPQRIIDLAPTAALLGSILGIEVLSRGSELVAMRAAGISMYSFSCSVGKLVFVIVTGTALFIQFVVPPSVQYAEKERVSSQISKKRRTIGDRGIWVRDDHQVLHIGSMWQGQVPTGLELYKFDSRGALTNYIQAKRADVGGNDEWELEGVREKIIKDGYLIQQHHLSMKWESFLRKNQLELLQSSAESLSISSLYQYIHYLRDTGQKSDRIELTFWKKIIMPLSIATLAMLGVPLGFTQHRPSIARQLTFGACIGILYFLLNEISTSIGLLSGFSPPLIAAFPLMAVIGLSCYLFWRVSTSIR